MAAELGTVRLGTLSGTLVLRLDDGSEVEVGRLDLPLDVHVGMTMPARSAARVEQDRDVDRREADEPEPAPVPLDRERIDALPVGSVVADRDGDQYTRRTLGEWERTLLSGRLDNAASTLPERYAPYTLVSTPAFPIGTRVVVVDQSDTIRELQQRVGIIIDPAARPGLEPGKVLVYIPSYESGLPDHSWSLDPAYLAREVG